MCVTSTILPPKRTMKAWMNSETLTNRIAAMRDRREERWSRVGRGLIVEGRGAVLLTGAVIEFTSPPISVCRAGIRVRWLGQGKMPGFGEDRSLRRGAAELESIRETAVERISYIPRIFPA